MSLEVTWLPNAMKCIPVRVCGSLSSSRARRSGETSLACGPGEGSFYDPPSARSDLGRGLRSAAVDVDRRWLPLAPGHSRAIDGTSDTSAANTPASSQRQNCRYIAAHGGRSPGITRQAQPLHATYLTASNTSRNACSRCPRILAASQTIRQHEPPFSSVTSDEYTLGRLARPSMLNRKPHQQRR